MKKVIFLIVFILAFTGSTDAQRLLKKLGKKVERAAEKVLERKVEEKTTEVTEEAVDSILNKKEQDQPTIARSGLSKATPADSYVFNHKVEMRIKSGKDVMDIDYFLPNSGNFLCSQIKDEKIKDDFFTVLDAEREAMFTYMESGGKKMKMAVDFKVDETEDDAPITITATGNTKKILGYNCKEYKMTGEDMTATIWVTKDVDIRFPSLFYNIKQKKSSSQEWMNDVDGWAMEMVMIDTSKKKPITIIMNCLSIEKSNFKIDSSDYQSLAY